MTFLTTWNDGTDLEQSRSAAFGLVEATAWRCLLVCWLYLVELVLLGCHHHNRKNSSVAPVETSWYCPMACTCSLARKKQRRDGNGHCVVIRYPLDLLDCSHRYASNGTKRPSRGVEWHNTAVAHNNTPRRKWAWERSRSRAQRRVPDSSRRHHHRRRHRLEWRTPSRQTIGTASSCELWDGLFGFSNPSLILAASDSR
jgi:hypothetical protein